MVIRWSWRISKRGVPTSEYAPLLRAGFEDLLPVLNTDFGFETINCESMNDSEASEAFAEKIEEVAFAIKRLLETADKLHEVRPKESTLLDLHIHFVGLAKATAWTAPRIANHEQSQPLRVGR